MQMILGQRHLNHLHLPLPKISSSLDYLHNGLALLVLDRLRFCSQGIAKMKDSLGDGTQGAIIDETQAGTSMPEFQGNL